MNIKPLIVRKYLTLITKIQILEQLTFLLNIELILPVASVEWNCLCLINYT